MKITLFRGIFCIISSFPIENSKCWAFIMHIAVCSVRPPNALSRDIEIPPRAGHGRDEH